VVEQFDPYAELGIDRDADDSAIKKAYRKRAKETHPDAGGDNAAFRRVELAYAVLSDKARRGRYDQTGVMQDDEPDVLRRAALQIIEGHLCGFLNQYVGTGYNPHYDPRVRSKESGDLLDWIADKIEREIAEARASINQGEKAIAFFRDMAARFVTKRGQDNFMRRNMEMQIRHNEQKLAMVHEGIPPRECALELLNDFTFRWEEPESDVASRSQFTMQLQIVMRTT